VSLLSLFEKTKVLECRRRHFPKNAKMTLPSKASHGSSSSRPANYSLNYSYPLLHKVLNFYKKESIDLSNFKIYSCQHLLESQYEMYTMFIEFGFKPENIFALGKIYSSNKEVIEEIKKLGVNVIQPEFGGQAFDIEHKNNCRNLAEKISDNDKNIIMDDGGYLIEAAKDKKIYFAVEQTSSGFRKLENSSLNFPIFNVARSKTKLTQESPLIARLISGRIEIYAKDNNIHSPKIVVIGLGPIGNSVLQVLSEDNYAVSGFDIETSKEKIIEYLLEEKPDLVIGATGTALLDESDLDGLESDHIYHFISVSSSDREFPVVSFRNNTPTHGDVIYKNFVFVNNGFPITFKGNRYESTPIEIEKTIALLMGSVLYGAVKGFNASGIIHVPEELEELINQ